MQINEHRTRANAADAAKRAQEELIANGVIKPSLATYFGREVEPSADAIRWAKIKAGKTANVWVGRTTPKPRAQTSFRTFAEQAAERAANAKRAADRAAWEIDRANEREAKMNAYHQRLLDEIQAIRDPKARQMAAAREALRIAQKLTARAKSRAKFGYA